MSTPIPNSPPTISQQLLDQAQALVDAANQLRATAAAANPAQAAAPSAPNVANATAAPPPNPDVDRLEARAAELFKGAVTLDVQNEAARIKSYLDKWVGEHKAFGDWKNEQTKSLISMSQSAIRLVLTINAGAAVALIAFLGNAVGKNANAVAHLFAGSLVVFAIGVAVAALVSVGSYITQFLYGEDESPKSQSWARKLHVVTLVGWFIGLGVFGWGCLQTYYAMQSMSKTGIGGPPAPSDTQTPLAPVPPTQVIYEVNTCDRTAPRAPQEKRPASKKAPKHPASSAAATCKEVVVPSKEDEKPKIYNDNAKPFKKPPPDPPPPPPPPPKK